MESKIMHVFICREKISTNIHLNIETVKSIFNGLANYTLMPSVNTIIWLCGKIGKPRQRPMSETNA